MPYTLRVSPEAREDLQDIWGYLSDFSEAAADQVVDAIADQISSLLEYPLKGQSRDELLPGLRSLVVSKYVVFYRVEDGFIIVSRILYGARDLNAIFSETIPDDRS